MTCTRFFAGLLLFATTAASAVSQDASLVATDRSFALALAGTSSTAVADLLDAEITWTDANGRTLSKAQTAEARPTLTIADETGAEVRRFEYGRVAVVQADRGREHVLRVWIRRGNDWRLLVYQEVRSLTTPPTTTPGTGTECVNPCRQVPYTPRSDEEREVIAAYQALETAAHAADVSRWGTHVAEEFILVSSNSDRTFTKEARLEGLRRASKGGVAPTRLLSADMIRESGVVVMRSQHEPDSGARLQITRVWVKRNNVWQSVLSYQTAIAGHR